MNQVNAGLFVTLVGSVIYISGAIINDMIKDSATCFYVGVLVGFILRNMR